MSHRWPDSKRRGIVRGCPIDGRPSMGQHNRGRIGISQSVRRLVRRGIVRGCPIDGLGRRWDSIIEVEYGLVWIDVWNCNVLQ